MPRFDPSAFLTKHAAEIAAIEQGLLNCEIPAQRTINVGFSLMGEPRFVGKDDRWEQITAHKDGSDYEPPPAQLMHRWASY
jgi:hypothetical protein